MMRPICPFFFEDDALLAVNKPAGIAVHGGSGISFGVIEALRQQRPWPGFSNSRTVLTVKLPAFCSSAKNARPDRAARHVPRGWPAGGQALSGACFRSLDGEAEA